MALASFARALGFSGLIPFVGLALAAWIGPWAGSVAVAQAQVAYGATILAFLGGLHWGAVLLARVVPEAVPESLPESVPGAVPADRPDTAGAAARAALLWGVTPSLIAWVALLVPAQAAAATSLRIALLLLAAGLVAARLVDARLYPAQAPGWFRQLRTVLTAVAVASLLATAVAAAH